MPFRSRGCLTVLARVAALAIASQETAAADLERTTVAAYDRFLETVAQAFSRQAGTDAFLTQASPQALDRLRHGEILLEPGSGDGIIEVPKGLIHHWRATAFVPDVTLEEVLKVARDYTKYASIYDWVVAADLVESEGGNRFRTFFRARRRAGTVTGVVDVWMVTEYRHLRPGRATSVARADCVRQVEHAGERGEHRLRPGTGNGYLWRADAMSKYLERDGGVYMELDAIGLSRGFPPLLGWIIEPVARRLGRGSAGESLRQLRVALTSPPTGVANASPVVNSRPWCGE
jgi:hypothetical protein